MNLEEIPLFSMLKSRLGYISQRETLIAANVANADTPGFAPKDLKPFTLPAGMSDSSGGGAMGAAMPMMQPTLTNPAHLTASGATAGGGGGGSSAQWKAVTGADSETTLDGNKVVLEDQMAKMTEARMDYEAAIGFYQKSLAMLRMAARAPGK